MKYTFMCPLCDDYCIKTSSIADFDKIDRSCPKCLCDMNQVIECPMLPKTTAFGDRVYRDTVED